MDNESSASALPSLNELGRDLLEISNFQKYLALGLPFIFAVAYFVFAFQGIWWLALLCPVLLSFFTYGSVSHDLVHRNLGLPGWVNESLLTAIELLTLRSGHAYRSTHLNHHAHFPDADDIEGASANQSFFRAFLGGMTLQPRLWFWAIGRNGIHRRTVWIEGLLAGLLFVVSFLLVPWTWVPAIYAAMVVAGAWIFPIITVVIPHDAMGKHKLTQTRLFRGRVLSWLALEHLYHLEHHLYPQVPHQNWAKLAKRLDPYFDREGIPAIKLLF